MSLFFLFLRYEFLHLYLFQLKERKFQYEKVANTVPSESPKYIMSLFYFSNNSIKIEKHR